MSSGGTVIDTAYAEMRADMVKLEADLKEMRQKVASAAAQASKSKVTIGVESGGGGLQGTIEKLNKAFGEESAFGKLVGAARGGAFLGSLEGFGNVLQDAADKAKEYNKDLRAGTITQGEFFTKTGLATPVIGTMAKGLKSAGESLWDWVAITSTATWKNRELADSYLSIGTQSALAAEKNAKFAKRAKDAETGNDETAKLRKQARDAGLSDDDRAKVQAADERAARDKEIRDRYNASTSETRGTQLREQLALSSKIYSDAIKRIDDAPFLAQAEERVGKVRGIVESLKQSAREATMSERDRIMADLKEGNARPDQIYDADLALRIKEAAEVKKKAEEEAKEAAKKAADEKKKAQDEELRRLENLKAKGKELYESVRTPAEKYRDELQRISDLLKEGGTDAENARRATQKAIDEYQASKPQMKVEFGDLSSFVQSMNARIANSRSSTAADEKARAEAQKKLEEANAKALAQVAVNLDKLTTQIRNGNGMTVTFEKR